MMSRRFDLALSKILKYTLVPVMKMKKVCDLIVWEGKENTYQGKGFIPAITSCPDLLQ